jgi:kynurenine formamidase
MALPPELKELAARVSNWGRWGEDDQRGTLNLIDRAAVLRGVAAVKQGRAFSLAIPFDEDGPQIGLIPGRDNPTRTMIAVNQSYTGDTDDFCTSDDQVTMGIQAATHWDSLAHVGYEQQLYNGVPFSEVDEAGCHKLGIDTVGPLVSRGVLLDVARALGVDTFADGHPITAEDLDAAVALTDVEIQPGDVLMVRTGQMAFLAQGDKLRFADPSPGLSTRSVDWLRDHDVGAIATDTLVFECWPCEDPAVLLPVHLLHLRDMGLFQGQLWFLDALAEDCAADGQYDGLLTATPLPFTGGAGSPVAPTLVK